MGRKSGGRNEDVSDGNVRRKYAERQEQQDADRREQGGSGREKVELTPDEDLPDY